MKFETFDEFKKIKNNNSFIHLDDDQLKDLQRQLLCILDDFDSVCKKEGIKYSLGGGTALGAIRHHGFIPWDDDVDVNMCRDDYEKFCRCFEHELSDRYWLHTPEGRPDLGLGFCKLRRKNSVFKTKEDFNNTQAGVNIDIFIVENTYNNTILRNLHGFLSLLSGFLFSCRNFYEYRDLYLSLNPDSRIFKTKIGIGRILSIFSVENYTKLWNNINKMCKNNKTDYVTIPCGRKHFFKELYPRKMVNNLIKVEFEKREMPIYESYDLYLKTLYNDYEMIPEKENRESHFILDYKPFIVDTVSDKK